MLDFHRRHLELGMVVRLLHRSFYEGRAFQQGLVVQRHPRDPDRFKVYIPSFNGSQDNDWMCSQHDATFEELI
jgi:hypothetical protein